MSEILGRDGKVHYLAEKCATCIFRPGNLMSLRKGRVKDMLEECDRLDTFIPCHETLPEVGLTEQMAVCAGYLATDRRGQLLRMAERMGLVIEVEPLSPAEAHKALYGEAR